MTSNEGATEREINNRNDGFARNTCDRCAFWQELDVNADGGYDITVDGTGLCRLLPPMSHRIAAHSAQAPANSMDAANQAFWPVTWGEDWCGAHSASNSWEAQDDALSRSLRRTGVERYRRMDAEFGPIEEQKRATEWYGSDDVAGALGA